MYPAPGSAEEIAAFHQLQQGLSHRFESVMRDPRHPHTVLVVPSLSLDAEELAKITGVHHYEERMLYLLMLLRKPRTRVIFVSSQTISPIVIDYFMNLLSGVPTSHARKRLVLFDCHDASSVPLSAKILARPRLLGRIKDALGPPDQAHLVCFNSSPLERTLAVRLGIPLYANDPDLSPLGSKSGSRKLFREAGVEMPDGFEDLRDGADIAGALSTLKMRHPELRRAVVKLNEGFSGEGNALYYYTDEAELSEPDRLRAIQERLHGLRFEAKGETWERFGAKYQQMQGVVECFVEGEHKRSPSAQCRVTPLLQPHPISTHDQVLGGPSGQVFEGCTFPADPAYRMEVQTAGVRVARALANHGAIGRFGIDFVSVPQPGQTGPDGAPVYKHYAIEINLRKGGTTHPFLTLRFLTNGHYDPDSGLFYAQGGKPKYYFASDTLQSARLKGLMPEDLIDIAVYHDLHFDAAVERGVVFHLVGALSEFGKLGLVCIGDNLQQAQFLYRKTRSVLALEGGEAPAGG